MIDKDQKLGVTERIANQVAEFPDVFANPLLGFLGQERPDILAYYPELDEKIRKLLRQELYKDGYFHVKVTSMDKGKNSSGDYPYVYQLIPDVEDPTWGQKYLPNVQKALHRRLAASTELDFVLGIGTVFVKLKPNNRMHVKKAIEWGQKDT